MSTIQQNLTRLQTAKSDISSAITTMGGVVIEGDGFEDFPSDILTIPSGGSIEGTITCAASGTLNVYYAFRSDEYIVCKWESNYTSFPYFNINGLLNDGETITVDFFYFWYYDTTSREYGMWGSYSTNYYSVANNVISIRCNQSAYGSLKNGQRYVLVAKVISSS